MSIDVSQDLQFFLWSQLSINQEVYEHCSGGGRFKNLIPLTYRKLWWNFQEVCCSLNKIESLLLIHTSNCSLQLFHGTFKEGSIFLESESNLENSLLFFRMISCSSLRKLRGEKTACTVAFFDVLEVPSMEILNLDSSRESQITLLWSILKQSNGYRILYSVLASSFKQLIHFLLESLYEEHIGIL